MGDEGDQFGFGEIGGDEGGAGEEVLAVGGRERVIKHGVALMVDKDGVNDQRYIGGNRLADGFHQIRLANEACLDGGGGVVGDYGGDLGAEKVRGHELDGRDFNTILGGDGGEGGHAVDAEECPCFEVGLDAGRAAAI